MNKTPVRQQALCLAPPTAATNLPEAACKEAITLLQQLLLSVHQATRQESPLAAGEERGDE